MAGVGKGMTMRGKVAKQAGRTSRRSLPPWTTGDGAREGVGMAEGEDLPGGREMLEDMGVDEQEDEGEDHLRTERPGGKLSCASDVGNLVTLPGIVPHQLLGRGKTRRAKLWASGRSDAP